MSPPRPAPDRAVFAQDGWWHIADVERQTGIGKDTLRVWEKRYGFPRPHRDARGERWYDGAQLQRLYAIKRLLDAGHRPGQVVPLGDGGLLPPARDRWRQPQGRAAFGASVPSALLCAELPDGDDAWAAICTAQPQRLRELLRAAIDVHGLAAVVEHTVAPLCVAVGDAWMRGEIGVYHEHLFTEAVLAVLRQAVAAVDAGQAAGLRPPRVLLTTAPGEQHALGLLMAECMLALAGCERVLLGVSTPLMDIVEAAAASQADVVALSFSLQARRREVIDAVTQLRQRLPERVALWVGGAGAQRPLRHPPAGVRVFARVTDVSAQVAAWRQAQGAAA